MNIERTLSIIKPDAVKKNIIGEIYTRFEKADLKIIASKMLLLSKKQAEKFYFIHKDQEFFPHLVNFMISGPIVVQVLEGENAVFKNRELMGPTDPKEAKKELLEEILLKVLMLILFMVQIVLKMQIKKLSFFSIKLN